MGYQGNIVMKVLIFKPKREYQFLLKFLSGLANTVIVDNEDDCINFLRDNSDIDLLMIHVEMVNESTIDFLGNLKKYQNDACKIIILTDSNDSVLELSKHNFGFIDFIGYTKDFEAIQQVVGKYQKIKKNDQHLMQSIDNINNMYKSVFQRVPIGVTVGRYQRPFYHWEDNFVSINEAFESITGRSKKELVELGWEKITHPDDIETNRELYRQFFEGEIDEFSINKRYIKPNNEIVWVFMHVVPLNYSYSSSTYVCLVQDITDKQNAERALIESERSKTVLLSNLPGMAYRCLVDQQWTMEYVSPGSIELTGYAPEDLVRNKQIAYGEVILPTYREKIWNQWQKQIKRNGNFKSEYEINTADGKVKWVVEIGQPIRNEDNEVVALEGIIIDITDRKKQELQLKFMSEHNMLTGLYNRLYLEKILTKSQKHRVKKQALLVLNFKKINIIRLTYGYSFGENIILNVSQTLSKMADETHELYYVSFERLAFLVKDVQSKEALEIFCNRILDQLVQLESMRTIGCNIGIFEINNYQVYSDTIIRNASIAAEGEAHKEMFGYQFFDESLDNKLKRESQLKAELVEEVHSPKRLSLHYQPILDLKRDKIVYFEALARFESDNLGNIPPSEFIPIAEESHLIIPLGKKILEDACDFLSEIHGIGFKDIKMSVNVSTVQVLSYHFKQDILDTLREKNINPHDINLEITESIFADNFDYINSILKELREHGITISIDDFGTGYSSLARERELNVNSLKIDKFFIEKLLMLEEEEAITGDIISMAHKLGHIVIAEGVETEMQKQYLIEHGCDLVQGYYFGKPIDKLSTLQLLKANKDNE